MVHLPFLSDPVPTLHEAAMARLLARRKEVEALGFQLIAALEVILDRRNGFVLRDVEVVVEVSPVRTHPREGPAQAFLITVDLGDRRPGDAYEGRGAAGKVVERWDVVAQERARGTAGVPGRREHEVVDYELAVGTEEVGEGGGLLLSGRVERGEGVRLGNFDDGEGAALGSERIAGAGEAFLLLEEGEAGGAVLGGRCNLWWDVTRVRLRGEKGRAGGGVEVWKGMGGRNTFAVAIFATCRM
jgi:hypothetical protein